MFNLIRRISYGVIPRTDRPWEEDPTSNAPNTKRKRRLSVAERDAVDDDEERTNTKKARGESIAASDGVAPVPNPQADTTEVKEMTKGVDEVTLDGKDEEPAAESAEDEVQAPTSASATTIAPESVPLPEDTSDELREFTAGPTPPRSTASSDENDAEYVEIAKEEPTTISVDEASDIASSSGDGEDADGECVPDPEPEPVAKHVVRSKKPVSTVKTTIHPETAAQA